MTKFTCKGCKHFYVTYEPELPWGCKAFGFKAKQMPYLQVRIVSGKDCELYAEGVRFRGRGARKPPPSNSSSE